jgi:hypothetical protein
VPSGANYVHTAANRRSSARAVSVAVDTRALVTVGLVTLLGLVVLLITPHAAWLPAT